MEGEPEDYHFLACKGRLGNPLVCGLSSDRATALSGEKTGRGSGRKETFELLQGQYLR